MNNCRDPTLLLTGDARVVHEHVKTVKLAADTLCCGSNRGLICDVELKGVGIRADALCVSIPCTRSRSAFLMPLLTPIVLPGTKRDRSSTRPKPLAHQPI
nr:hypothetical protein [Nodosilinea sp. LEGE 07088]